MIRDTAQEIEQQNLDKGQKILKSKQSLLLHETNKNINCLYMFGETIFCGTKLSKLFVYQYDFDKKQIQHPKILIPHCESVSLITASTKYFITVPEAEDESNISVWNLSDMKFMTSLSGHTSQVSGAVFLSQENILATSSWDGTVKIWNLQNILDVTAETITADYPVLCIDQYKKQFIIFGGDDCYISLYNWITKELVTKCFGHAGSVSFLYANPDYFISCGGDQMIKIWEITEESNSESISKEESKGDGMMIEMQQMENKPQKVKLKLTTTNSQKKYYDSCIYMMPLDRNTFFFIDRHGQKFILRNKENNTQVFYQKNQFLYYDSITGVVRPTKDKLLISTAKGDLFQYGIEPRYLRDNQEKQEEIQL